MNQKNNGCRPSKHNNELRVESSTKPQWRDIELPDQGCDEQCSRKIVSHHISVSDKQHKALSRKRFGMKCAKQNKTNKVPLIVATHLWDRMAGFLIRRPDQCILLISPCNSIHTFGMTGRLDVAFFDAGGVVIKSQRGVCPRRIMSCKGAHGVLERRALHTRAWYDVGDAVMLNI